MDNMESNWPTGIQVECEAPITLALLKQAGQEDAASLLATVIQQLLQTAASLLQEQAAGGQAEIMSVMIRLGISGDSWIRNRAVISLIMAGIAQLPPGGRQRLQEEAERRIAASDTPDLELEHEERLAAEEATEERLPPIPPDVRAALFPAAAEPPPAHPGCRSAVVPPDGPGLQINIAELLEEIRQAIAEPEAGQEEDQT